MIDWQLSHYRTGKLLRVTGNHPLDWQLAHGPVWLFHPVTGKLIEIDGENPKTWKYVPVQFLWSPSRWDFAREMRLRGIKVSLNATPIEPGVI